MHFKLSFLLILGAVIATYAEPQYQFGYYNNPYFYGGSIGPYRPSPFGQFNHFRAGYPQPSFENQSAEDRLFFGTVTLTVSTTTSTSILTWSTTCTTSTKAISICSPSGRRRRGLSINGDKKVRGLFYNENNEEELDDSGVFLRKSVEEAETIAAEKESVRVAREDASELVPFVLEPGMSMPDGNRKGRFMIKFVTSTVLTTSTSTYAVTLTAMCKSTTAFGTCGTSGK